MNYPAQWFNAQPIETRRAFTVLLKTQGKAAAIDYITRLYLAGFDAALGSKRLPPKTLFRQNQADRLM